jgi:Ca2+-transporting ATPase
MAFTVLTLSQLAHVMAIRSDKISTFSLGFFSNRYLAMAVCASILLQMAIIYMPTLNAIFKTQPLTLSELTICFALSSVIFIAVEIEKWLVRTDRLYYS